MIDADTFKRDFIHPLQLPPRVPMTQTAVLWLLLDRWQPALWVWWVMGTLMLCCWAVTLLDWVLCYRGRMRPVLDEVDGMDEQRRHSDRELNTLLRRIQLLCEKLGVP